MGKAARHPGATTDRTVHGAGVWSMATGTVKWFNAEKGYGFVTPDDGGRDLFVHYTGIEGSGYRTLSEGQKVEYEATQGQKGPQATKVRVLAYLVEPPIVSLAPAWRYPSHLRGDIRWPCCWFAAGPCSRAPAKPLV